MKWTLLVYVRLFALCEYVQSHPALFDGHNGRDKVENESWKSEWKLSPKAHGRAEGTLLGSDKDTHTHTDKEDMFTAESNHHHAESPQVAESRSGDIVDVLKSLNLPPDFAIPMSSTSRTGSAVSLLETLTAAMSSGRKTDKNGGSADGPTVPSPILASASETSSVVDEPKPRPAEPQSFVLDNPQPQSRSTEQLYMTGNVMLDKIMNCPCAMRQLRAVGVKGVAYFNHPDPAIYREPPYGPEAIGPGDHIATNLKSVGGSTGNVFGQIIRLVLGLPTLAAAFLKPLIVGLADTLAQTTEAGAEVTAQTAKQLPVVIRSSAVVIKRLLETFGDVTGSFLHVFSNVVAALASAKTSLAGTLPFAFDALNDVSTRVSGTVGTAVDFISGTTEVLSAGVVQAAKTKGNLFSGLVEGAKGFQSGLLEGIKYGVNDETPPDDPNAQAVSAWRR